MSTHAQVLRLRRARLCLAMKRQQRYCLLPVRTRSAHENGDFGAQWLACVSSCRCHTREVSLASVRLKARVTGYVFSVGLFHSQSQAGLSRRFLWLGDPGRLPAPGSHRPVRARISAYGSSDHGFAARLLSVPVPLIRCSDYDASVVFPKNGSMIRHPASLHRVPGGPVPPLLRYYQDATTSCLPSHRTSFPSLGGTTVASSVRSTQLKMPKLQARGVLAIAGHPQSRPSCRGKGRISQVPARPQSPVCTCSSTPAEPTRNSPISP